MRINPNISHYRLFDCVWLAHSQRKHMKQGHMFSAALGPPHQPKEFVFWINKMGVGPVVMADTKERLVEFGGQLMMAHSAPTVQQKQRPRAIQAESMKRLDT